jgi:hypothetical protein
VKFFYDGNMSGSRDETEPFLSPIVKGYQQSQDGCYYVPEGKETRLYITGKAPNGKDLLNATLDWPMGVNLLPQITVDTTKTREIGLVDGFCSSPIKPEDFDREFYNQFIRNPDSWFNAYAKFFEGGEEKPNWYFYGYYVPPPIYHRALDIFGKEGTPVHAPVPGKVVKGNYDHIIGIQGPYGKLDLNHITPTVKYGECVAAGDLVGYIGKEWHVHVELYNPPNASNGNPLILECFPGLSRQNLLISPREGPPPALPYFGR